ncbi:hypothetical protein LCGC14_1125440 [marine sediment metagenome]|uniref:Uncharacterized protein n=1 Tax=marine sediment metagenome TaxID=412755 RepID=A0A0F9M7H7_9ZZZZ
MYVEPDFKTKANLEFAVAQGQIVSVYDPGPFSGGHMINGEVDVEGPLQPGAWKWRARVTITDGKITKVFP